MSTSAPVDWATLSAQLGDDRAGWIYRYQGGYVATSAMSLFLGGLAWDRLGSTMLARETKPVHRLALLSLLVLITLKTAVEIWSIYLISIPRMGSVTALWINPPQMIAAETNVVIALVVQGVFIDRIYTLYAARPRLARGIAGALVTLSFVGFALGTVMTVYTIAFISHGNDFSSTAAAYQWRFMSAMSVPAVEDILITGLMLWRLREIDGAFSDGDARSITFRLALVTLQTNALTGIFVIGTLIAAALHSPNWNALFLLIGPLYIFSVLANLRSRQGVRRALDAQRRQRRQRPIEAEKAAIEDRLAELPVLEMESDAHSC